MQEINLDASPWKETGDFYDAVLASVQAPSWHGKNINALIDSLIFGGVNASQPPYILRISNLAKAPGEVSAHVRLAQATLAEARQEFRQSRDMDVEVILEIVS